MHVELKFPLKLIAIMSLTGCHVQALKFRAQLSTLLPPSYALTSENRIFKAASRKCWKFLIKWLTVFNVHLLATLGIQKSDKQIRAKRCLIRVNADPYKIGWNTFQIIFKIVKDFQAVRNSSDFTCGEKLTNSVIFRPFPAHI